MIAMKEKPVDGWYWCLVQGFRSSTYTFHQEWIMVEFDQWWRWDTWLLKRKGLSDMTNLIRYVGPIERPEVAE